MTAIDYPDIAIDREAADMLARSACTELGRSVRLWY